jgi:hypothetical protein
MIVIEDVKKDVCRGPTIDNSFRVSVQTILWFLGRINLKLNQSERNN